MSIYLGDIELTSILLGDVVDQKIYLGDLLVLDEGVPLEELDRHVVYDVSNIAEEFSNAPSFDSGLILNGTFDTGIENWVEATGTLSWNEELLALQSNGYCLGNLSEDIPAGTEITVEFDVDVSLGGNAGYCDIYQWNGTTSSNWQKVYYTVVDNKAHISHTFTTDGNITTDININFNHEKMCTADNVSLHAI